MAIKGTCAMCHQPGHRFGTTDPEHDYNAIACVNSLMVRTEALEAEVSKLSAVLAHRRAEHARCAVKNNELQAEVEKWKAEVARRGYERDEQILQLKAEVGSLRDELDGVYNGGGA